MIKKHKTVIFFACITFILFVTHITVSAQDSFDFSQAVSMGTIRYQLQGLGTTDRMQLTMKNLTSVPVRIKLQKGSILKCKTGGGLVQDMVVVGYKLSMGYLSEWRHGNLKVSIKLSDHESSGGNLFFNLSAGEEKTFIITTGCLDYNKRVPSAADIHWEVHKPTEKLLKIVSNIIPFMNERGYKLYSDKLMKSNDKISMTGIEKEVSEITANSYVLQFILWRTNGMGRKEYIEREIKILVEEYREDHGEEPSEDEMEELIDELNEEFDLMDVFYNDWNKWLTAG
jgi:hypothetical protein